MKPSLSILLPVFNPTLGWEKNVVLKYNELYEKLDSEFELFLQIVNDGSIVEINSKSLEFIKSNIDNFNYFEYKENKGKGFALRYAIQKIDSDFIVYTDIDFPYEISSILEVVKKILNVEVVIGIKDKTYYQHLPKQRKFISLLLQKMIRFIFHGLLTSDTQCGLKGMNRKGKDVFLKTTINRYLFDLEFVYLLKKYSIKSITSEVKLRDGISFRKMNNKILFQELINFLKILIK